MSQIIPPNLDPLPEAPTISKPSVFADVMDVFLAALVGFRAQLVSLGQNLYSNAVDAYNSAVAAAASAVASAASAADASKAAAAASIAANVTKWTRDAIYNDGAVVWSPADNFPYRRMGTGAGTTDPKFDPSHWALQLFSLGLGGITITGGINLASTSPAGMCVTPTEPGLYAYLPDATTCPKSALQQVIYNSGEYDYGIRDFTGNVLGWLRPGATAIVGLVDNSIPAGVWMISGLSKTAVTAQYSSAVMSYSGGEVRRITIDSTRTMLLLPGSAGIYALIYDSSTRAWTATLVRAGAVISYGAVLSAANQVLLVATTYFALEAVTLTISGSSVSSNTGTKQTVSMSASNPTVGDPVAVGASWVMPVYDNPNYTVRAVTISGTTPSVGGATVVPSTNGTVIFASGSVARVLSISSSAITLTPYTVTGTSLAAGTAASVSCDTPVCRITTNGNGNILVLYSSTQLCAAVFKLTGTAEAATYAVADSTIIYTGTSALSSIDLAAISASKTLFCVTAGGVRMGVITDSAGSVSVGASGGTAGSSVYPPTILGISGTTARLAIGTGLVRIDCSGTTPSVIDGAVTDLEIPPPAQPYSDGRRHPYVLTAGSGMTSTTYTISPVGASATWHGQYGQSRVRANPRLAIRANGGVAGAAANESWILGTGAVTNIYHVEAAA